MLSMVHMSKSIRRQLLILRTVSLKRSKGQYDGVCQEVESKRKKVDSSFDSG